MNKLHLLACTGYRDMRTLYSRAHMIPTSEIADIALIRSWIAYWQGSEQAERAEIKASRGHSYRVAHNGKFNRWTDSIVRIVDHYDHRKGVQFVSRDVKQFDGTTGESIVSMPMTPAAQGLLA